MIRSIDILMITHNRPQYTRLSLERLLDTCDEDMRVWVWQNGNDQETIDVVESFWQHPRFYKYFHSSENKKLNDPTNWLWSNSDAAYFGKVDDDCLVPFGWGEILRKAHQDVPEFGVIGCWHYTVDDFKPELANKKIHQIAGGHKIMRNCWLGGSGYLMKRECYEKVGSLTEKMTFTTFCVQTAKLGYINGWYYPFLYQEHLDDPRSENTLLKCDEDMRRWAPLSAINNGVVTIEAWQAQLQHSARYLQEAPFDPKYYSGWRKCMKSVRGKIKRIFGIKKQW